MRPTTIGPLLVALLLVGGCRDGHDQVGKRPSDKQLAGLVLHTSDLGRGYEEFANGRTRRVELDPALDADPSRFDRQDGWTARYRSVGKGFRRRPLTLVSSVDVFDTSSGATRFFDAASSTAGVEGSLESMKIPRLGNESRELVSAPPPGGVGYLKIVWRDGRAVSSLMVTAFPSGLKMDELVALARRQSAKSRILN